MTAWAHSPPEGARDTIAHPLRDHLDAVAALARDAAPTPTLGEVAWLAGLWHDLGKYRPAFQSYVRGRGPQTSHKLAGAQLALDRHGSAVGRLLALVIAGHHGGLPGWATTLKGRLPEAATELAEATGGGAPADLLGQRVPVESESAIQAWLSQLPKTDQLIAAEILVRALYGCLVDADYRDTAAFYDPQAEERRLRARRAQAPLSELARRLDAALEDLMQRATDLPVQRWRREVLEACRAAADQPPGVFELTVPTGGGKTLASMSFALRHAVRNGLRRVVVAIPFTSIVEQNAGVYADVLGRENVLEHHSAWDPDAIKDLAPRLSSEARHRTKLLTENWDAPVVVTTNVQLLESLHANRPAACRKLHSLAGSVVILDEAQTLPPSLLKPTLDTLRALARSLRVTIVTCTATQPALARRTDGAGMVLEGLGVPERIIDRPGPLFSAMRRVKVRWPDDLTSPVSWDHLAEAVRRHARALVIVHRRADARDLAERLGESAVHLSASMLPAHRSRTLGGVRKVLATNQDSPCAVVATQVVEAGVDIDFPIVFRAFAGLDSLAQAAGRCNREGRFEAGELHVFVAPTQPPPGILERAQRIARVMAAEAGGQPDLDDPTLYQRFYERLYDASDLDARAIDALRKGLDSDFPEIAREYRIIDDRHQVALVVPWRGLDAPTLRAIERLQAGFADLESFRRVRRATVNAPRRVVRSWLERGAVTLAPRHPVPILDTTTWPQLYSDRFGLDLNADPALAVEDLVL